MVSAFRFLAFLLSQEFFPGLANLAGHMTDGMSQKTQTLHGLVQDLHPFCRNPTKVLRWHWPKMEFFEAMLPFLCRNSMKPKQEEESRSTLIFARPAASIAPWLCCRGS